MIAPAPTPVVVSNGDELAQRDVTRRFIDALDARDFDAAHALLVKPLRARYTVARLSADFAAEPLAVARVTKIRAHLDDPIRGAAIEWSPGRFLRFALEPEGWRVAAIE